MDNQRKPSPACEVCDAPPRAVGSHLCGRCWTLLHRKDAKRRKRGWKIDGEVRLSAMKKQYDKKAGGFICKLTGVKLSDQPTSPLRPTWEHLVPGDPSTAVLAASILNHMKSDLTRSQFKSVVTELARLFADPSRDFNRRVLPKEWRPKAST